MLTYNSETLVIGKALDPHSFRDTPQAIDREAPEVDTRVELTGLTSPWNTFAIWDLSKLAKVSFGFGMHGRASLISASADWILGAIGYECPTRPVRH